MIKWYAIIGDFNTGTIKNYNVFEHRSFTRDAAEAIKKAEKEPAPASEIADVPAAFADAIKKALRYYFWSKCEWEVVVSHWPPAPDNPRFRDEKIDVDDQIEANFAPFLEYTWAHRADIKKLAREYAKK